METTTERKAEMLTLLPDIVEGEPVKSVFPLVWTISEELVAKMATRGFANPHLLILIASRTTRRSSEDYSYETYEVDSVHLRSLTGVPREYLQFQRSGESVIIGMVIDLDDKLALAIDNLKKHPDAIDLSGKQIEVLGAPAPLSDVTVMLPGGKPMYVMEAERKVYIYLDRYGQLDYAASAVVTVDIDPEQFAKPIAKWRRDLHDQYPFFGGERIDQCDSRGVTIMAIALAIPIQFYGIFVRLATLLYGLFMAKRNMDFAELFAFNPHEFGRSLGYTDSFWLQDKDGHDRNSWWVYITPPALFIEAVVLSVATLVMLAVGAVFALIFGGGEITVGFWTVMFYGFLAVAALAAVIFSFWLAFSKGYQARSMRDTIRAWFSKRQEARHMSEDGVDDRKVRLYEQLRFQATAQNIRSAKDVRDKTLWLGFNRAKSEVCLPYDKNTARD